LGERHHLLGPHLGIREWMISFYRHFLVVIPYPGTEKNEFVSWDDDIPN
jgi:hypothetical protein